MATNMGFQGMKLFNIVCFFVVVFDMTKILYMLLLHLQDWSGYQLRT